MSAKRLYIGLIAAFCLVGIAWGVIFWLQNRETTEDPLKPDQEVVQAAKKLIESRQELDRTVWRSEVDAQRYETTFVQLWDELRSAENKTEVLKRFPFRTLIYRDPADSNSLDQGIRSARFTGAKRTVNQRQWLELADTLHGAGLRLIQSEWHHAKFIPDSPPRSTITFSLHLEDENTKARYLLKGSLLVGWSASLAGAKENPRPATIEVESARLLSTTESPRFEAHVVSKNMRADGFAAFYDLNGDGLLEMVTGPNRVWWNEGGMKFRAGELCEQPGEMLTCGALADVNGDGQVDLICGTRNRRLWWLAGLPPATRGDYVFAGEPQEIAATEDLENPSALAVGDIDNDGDLDIWVAQYKYPYIKGQMPTPYFNANDGYQSHLLLNDGQGKFTNQTVQAGLTQKRNRRTYSCSFLDLDDDGDLDLLVNSDFAGIDLYRNDGQGHFKDVTTEMVSEHHNFGMSHTLADYNLDGSLDFFVTGMSSTTARRLDSMKAELSTAPEYHQMRKVMGYGNRMYLRQGAEYQEPAFKDQVARTGWSWGSTSFDFDNDGDHDIYIANGHISGKTAQDYCTKFWCHDIYSGDSRPSAAMEIVFKTDSALNDMSWNGFEHNCLLLNLAGKDFVEVGFLHGLAFEYDSRAVIGGDLDGDGAVDLYVGQHHKDGFQTSHVYRNRSRRNRQSWIGVRLYEEGSGISPLGAKIRVKTNRGTKVAQLVTGDSFNAQHGNVVHFGLGPGVTVESIEVRWQNGQTASLPKPALAKYHRLSPKPQ